MPPKKQLDVGQLRKVFMADLVAYADDWFKEHEIVIREDPKVRQLNNTITLLKEELNKARQSSQGHGNSGGIQVDVADGTGLMGSSEFKALTNELTKARESEKKWQRQADVHKNELKSLKSKLQSREKYEKRVSGHRVSVDGSIPDDDQRSNSGNTAENGTVEEANSGPKEPLLKNAIVDKTKEENKNLKAELKRLNAELNKSVKTMKKMNNTITSNEKYIAKITRKSGNYKDKKAYNNPASDSEDIESPSNGLRASNDGDRDTQDTSNLEAQSTGPELLGDGVQKPLLGYRREEPVDIIDAAHVIQVPALKTHRYSYRNSNKRK